MAQLTRQLMVLSKPRIVALLLFTALCGMWRAAEGTPPLWTLLAVLVGGALSASGSNAINQGLDSDIDAIMLRTRGRPVPARQVSSRAAVMAGAGAIGVGVVTMGVVANWLSALLTLAAAAIYVFVYTVALKRHSWNNIVVGGAAGALPPLIGATAITGAVEAQGLFMFGMIFFWTPPHFWALSLLLKKDYAAARVPMLAAVGGDRATGTQILLYVVLLLVMGWLPLASGYGGPLFPAVATLLGLEWLRRAWLLRRNASSPLALRAYKFSLLYLAVVFLALGVEPLLPGY